MILVSLMIDESHILITPSISNYVFLANLAQSSKEGWLLQYSVGHVKDPDHMFTIIMYTLAILHI